MKRCYVITAILLLACMDNIAGSLVPDAPINCPQCENWNRPQEPFRVFGNTYYVGTAELSSILIVTEGGLVLIDGALPQSVPLIDVNIRQLGFNTEDIKLILNSHTHFDHAGGIAALQHASSATVAVSASSAIAFKQGRPVPDDPQFNSENNGFPIVSDVQIIADGETLTVGDFRITAHFTPGHTPGGTTWTWQACEDDSCLNIVYADSLNAVSADGFRFTGGSETPSIIDAFRETIHTVEEMPCDILLSPHTGFFDLQGKLLQRRNGRENDVFVDPGACHAYATAAAKRLDLRIAEENSSR